VPPLVVANGFYNTFKNSNGLYTWDSTESSEYYLNSNKNLFEMLKSLPLHILMPSRVISLNKFFI